MSTAESNKTVVKDFIDGLFTKGDLGTVDTYLAEDFINHDPPFGVTPDREGMRTAGGTHRGEVMGVPATGRSISLPGINIFRLRDGLIVERWGLLDDLGFLKQLGVVPA